MRRRHLGWTVGYLVTASVLLGGPASADFNPFGRSRPKKPPASAPTAPKAGQGQRPPAAAPRREPPAERVPQDAQIQRYRALALARPGESFPVERLVELHRKKDGSLDALVAELSVRADKAGSEQYAALVVLGGVLRHDAEHDRAISAYERAVALEPKNPIAILALGRLLSDRGDKAGARRRFEEALPAVKAEAERGELLHALVGLALDLGDFDAAKRFHEERVREAKGSFFTRSELGKDLRARGHIERALVEFRDLVKAAGGDNRAMAPALTELGKTLAQAGNRVEAIEVLKRALAVAGGQSGLRREILLVMVDAYRSTGGVGEIVALLEKERPGDFERLTLLASLYEELGRADDALRAYERALSQRDDIATRQKVVHLLEVQGRIDEAVKQQERLTRSAPSDPEIAIRYAEALLQRGDRARALESLERFEARVGDDDEILPLLVDFYERVEEPTRAGRLLDHLARGGARDPRHLVELGDHYFRQGDSKRALEVWGRIRTAIPEKARGLLTYGEVLLDHDMAEEALAALEQAAALAPGDPRHQKALALALERTATTSTGPDRARRLDAARRIWEKRLLEGGGDAAVLREARLHIVTLWGLDGRLAEHARPLERRLSQKPPDLEAGRLLGEVYMRLRRPADAERALSRVVAGAPGDVEAHLALERALTAQRKLALAIPVVERLVKIDPRRAREAYRRLAEYAAELYRDDDAVRYAARAVELSPDDAEGHRKLGDMYRRRQDVEHAVIELRRAISKNDRLFPVYFDLAELLLSRGDLEEADGLLRKVVRASPDDDLVGRAARLAIQVNVGRGTLDSLERDLLAVALGSPQRALYRRLLVEVYDTLAFPLVHDARGPDEARAREAREKLAQLGERAVKPLLDTLGDDRLAQQRTAIALLSFVSNRGAGPALVAFAMGKGDGELRTRAMLAAGALSDPELLPRLRDVIAPQGSVRVDETDTVAVAAAWAVARMKSPRARPLLHEMLESDAPSVRALGAVGLGLAGNAADAGPLVALLEASHEPPALRAACALAVAALGGQRAIAALTRAADSGQPALRAAGVLGLSRLGAAEARRSVAHALVSPDAEVRAAAVSGALVLSTGSYRVRHETLPVPEGRVELRGVLAALSPAGYTADERARALVDLEAELREAALAAIQGASDGARRVADALLSRAGRPAFAPLTDGIDLASPAARQAAEAALSRLAAALVERYVALTKHPVAEVRARAVRVLALSAEPAAVEALSLALSDPDEVVQQAALAAVAAPAEARTLVAVATLARKAPTWSLRARAVEALGRLAVERREGGPAGSEALAVLVAVAEQDPVDFVRESAIRALGASSHATARAALGRLSSRDAEPRLRLLARSLIERAR